MKTILEQANEIVHERSEEKSRQYGPFIEGMSRAAQIMRGSTGKDITASDMYLALVALKLSRNSYSYKRDNLLDAVAYIGALDAYLSEKPQTQNQKDNTMNLTNEFQPIRDWAYERELIQKGDNKTQVVKLMEEVGELSVAILKKNHLDLADAIGDCVVVLTNLAELNGMSIESCINSAFQQIVNRKGKMQDGTFVKEQ
jgi:NTP pyrophosphatase (non-canonical NTP hydrolase)